jgi:predicted component of type VI protein secretion system
MKAPMLEEIDASGTVLATHPLTGAGTIGRQGCDVALEDASVEERHCFVRPSDEGLLLTNLVGSGVYVEVRGVERVLRSGAEFRIGDNLLRVESIEEEKQP